jgi:hypothetical protein
MIAQLLLADDKMEKFICQLSGNNLALTVIFEKMYAEIRLSISRVISESLVKHKLPNFEFALGL